MKELSVRDLSVARKFPKAGHDLVSNTKGHIVVWLPSRMIYGWVLPDP